LYAEAVFTILAYLTDAAIFKLNVREKETAEVAVMVGCEVWCYLTGWVVEKQMKSNFTHSVEALMVTDSTYIWYNED
jgi:hypothetical protein